MLEEKVDEIGERGMTLQITRDDQKEESKNLIETSLRFLEDNSLILIQNGETTNVKFKIIDSTLTLGSRQYKILELGENVLKLSDESTFLHVEYIYRKK